MTEAEKLVNEYRPTIPVEVLHLWAVDAVALIRKQEAEIAGLIKSLEWYSEKTVYRKLDASTK